MRQGRRPLLLGLRRRPRPDGASSAAAAPCALLHCQMPPSGPQGSSVNHRVPCRVHPRTREAMHASATAAGPQHRRIPDGAPSVAAGSGACLRARIALPEPQEFLSVVKVVTHCTQCPPQPSMVCLRQRALFTSPLSPQRPRTQRHSPPSPTTLCAVRSPDASMYATSSATIPQLHQQRWPPFTLRRRGLISTDVLRRNTPPRPSAQGVNLRGPHAAASTPLPYRSSAATYPGG